MSVLIKGMEMPSVCDRCWALDESGDYPMCRITGETRGYNFCVREKRMDRCPLIELPDPVKHGRWVCGCCDQCGYILHSTGLTNYCPNCGAKMYGGRG